MRAGRSPTGLLEKPPVDVTDGLIRTGVCVPVAVRTFVVSVRTSASVFVYLSVSECTSAAVCVSLPVCVCVPVAVRT